MEGHLDMKKKLAENLSLNRVSSNYHLKKKNPFCRAGEMVWQRVLAL